MALRRNWPADLLDRWAFLVLLTACALTMAAAGGILTGRHFLQGLLPAWPGSKTGSGRIGCANIKIRARGN